MYNQQSKTTYSNVNEVVVTYFGILNASCQIGWSVVLIVVVAKSITRWNVVQMWSFYLLTRNKLGTLATITPLVVRQANQDHIWEKQRLPWGEVIYYNQTTTETLRRAPEGAFIRTFLELESSQ